MSKEKLQKDWKCVKLDEEIAPFNKKGGLGKMWQLFGEQTDEILNELNEVLAA